MKRFERTLIWLCLGVFLVGLVMLAWAVPASAATHQLEDLGGFLPEDINRWGQMAGSWCDGVKPCRPARHDGKTLEILDERQGSAWAINNQGDVVAEVFDEAAHALFIAADGTCEELSFGDSFWTRAIPLNLNDAREIVGILRISGSTGVCPARWASPTAEPECFVEFASNGWLQALNQGGTLAGFWQSDEFGEDLTFRWHEETGIVPLPFGTPAAINEAGWIIYEHGDLVSPTGSVVSFGELEGCGNTSGADINNLRLVHGQSGCADGQRGWVWHEKTGFLDLTTSVNDPIYVIRRAKALNDLGQVVAWAEHVPTSIFHGVRLTPALVAKILERRR